MMEKKELIDTINDAIFFALSNLHTATIAKVQTVNTKTVDVQPVINRVVDGRSIQLPVFTQVPPLFMQGGLSYEALPIAVGDYCLLILTERCFDRWYSGADFQNPSEFRMHDYSDGIAIFGVNPLASAKTIPSLITRVGNSTQTGDLGLIGNYNQTGAMIVSGSGTFGSVVASGFTAGVAAGVSGDVTAGGFTMTFTNGLLTGLVPV